MSSTKTVKVRIAVAVDEEGQWRCAGWMADPDDKNAFDDMMEIATEDLLPGEECYWLEAVLPLPNVKTIFATVTRDRDSNNA